MNNFVVSARKYRPATFNSVVGQNHITSTLKNAISRDQLAHAYLFCGPRGVGKTTCARIFAKAINCLAPVDSEACGECESCRGFNEGRSFNIHELDAASNNSVDDIRSLTDQVRIPPQIGRYSVYIIDEVHMLSTAAFNAFLKTLEEPPAHAVFILATTEKHKILPTILSRCQIFDFNRIRVEDGVQYLKYIAGKENIATDDESLHLIAQKADGGMRDALSMFDKAVSFCGSSLNFKEVAQTLNVLDYDTYFKLTSIILSGDYQATLMMFDEVLRKGFSGQLFISGLGSHFRDVLMSKNPQTLPLLEVTGSLLERYKAQATECSAGFLFESIGLITALDGTLKTATNQRLNIELGLMKLCGLSQKKNSDLGSTIDPQAVAPQLPPLKRSVESVVRQANVVSAVSNSVSNTQSVHSTVQTTQSVPTAGADANPASSGTGVPMSAENLKAVAGAEASAETHAVAGVEAAGATQASQPKMESRAAIHAMPMSISGNSIADILSGKSTANGESTDEDGEGEPTVENVDSESQVKIHRYRERFINALRADRPRFAVAFGDMQVRDNIITVNVPNEALLEDILRNKTEILMLLAKTAGVNGMLDLKVVLREDDPSKRLPVKVEDKLRYLTEKNPMLNQLRRALNLDIE